MYLNVGTPGDFDKVVSATWSCRNWHKSPLSEYSQIIHIGSDAKQTPKTLTKLGSLRLVNNLASCSKSPLEEELESVRNDFTATISTPDDSVNSWQTWISPNWPSPNFSKGRNRFLSISVKLTVTVSMLVLLLNSGAAGSIMDTGGGACGLYIILFKSVEA